MPCQQIILTKTRANDFEKSHLIHVEDLKL